MEPSDEVYLMEMDVQEEIRKLRADLDKHVQISAHNVSVFTDSLKHLNDNIRERYDAVKGEVDQSKKESSDKLDMYMQSITEESAKLKKRIEDAEKYIKSYRFNDIFQEIQALEEEFKKRALKLISESSVSAKK